MKKLFGIAFLLAVAIFAHGQSTMEGIWLTQDKDAKIEIVRTPQNTYEGSIIWGEDINDKNGKPKLNTKDPDPSRRTLPLLGLELLKDFTQENDKVYSGGTIYDPEKGKTYKCKATLRTNDELEVRGYIGIPALGRTVVWTRVKE